jgi:hypothetical protein
LTDTTRFLTKLKLDDNLVLDWQWRQKVDDKLSIVFYETMALNRLIKAGEKNTMNFGLRVVYTL